MLSTSALLTSVNFFSLRMRPGLFVPIKWRLPECPRLILPFAVNLKRFLAPRWVFNFNFGFDLFLGIAGNPLVNSCCQIMFYPAKRDFSLRFAPFEMTEKGNG